MINLKDYNAICARLPAAFHVVQWGGSHVWKVGGLQKGKVFAIASFKTEIDVAVTFKTSPMSYDILKEQPGLRPAPYLASRGMKWIQMHSTETLFVDDLKAYLALSHKLAAENLTKKLQKEFNLVDYLNS